jgi:hypothetical protein
LDRPDRLLRVRLDLLDGLADLLEVDVVESHALGGAVSDYIRRPTLPVEIGTPRWRDTTSQRRYAE